ncbi:hypothetical protein HMPREF1210_01561 [Paenisporosarcina sp. HGH0030]|nr:hypothetical protein HMPREF1210_01561 [Paenisporosarcina sp. HGH0030]
MIFSEIPMGRVCSLVFQVDRMAIQIAQNENLTWYFHVKLCEIRPFNAFISNIHINFGVMIYVSNWAIVFAEV